MLARQDQSSRHSPLKTTPLHALHASCGGKMVPFAGYDMPVQYATGVLREHLHTRTHAGLFDVSHMGQIALRPKSGKVEDAALALERLVPQDIVGVAAGRQRYAQFTNAAGGILDDLMVANFGSHLFVVVNAACKAEDEAHLRANLSDVCVIEALADRALIALQGPKASAVLEKFCPEAPAMRFMDAGPHAVDGIDCFVSRSGYTGEDGFEIFASPDDAEFLWAQLSVAGTGEGLVAAGLAARDTLRLEAGMPLYGNELGLELTPFDAGLGRVVKLDKPGYFVGRESLAARAETPPVRQLVGLTCQSRRVPRHGYEVLWDGKPGGFVTSGAPSPTLGVPIAMAYVRPDVATEARGVASDGRLAVDIRGHDEPATLVELPFYRRSA
jgi:aminomethyltransferase